MAIDKNKNSQILLTVTKELLKRIEDYQFEGRFKNRNEAVRSLIKEGLETAENKKSITLTDD